MTTSAYGENGNGLAIYDSTTSTVTASYSNNPQVSCTTSAAVIDTANDVVILAGETIYVYVDGGAVPRYASTLFTGSICASYELSVRHLAIVEGQLVGGFSILTVVYNNGLVKLFGYTYASIRVSFPGNIQSSLSFDPSLQGISVTYAYLNPEVSLGTHILMVGESSLVVTEQLWVYDYKAGEGSNLVGHISTVELLQNGDATFAQVLIPSYSVDGTQICVPWVYRRNTSPFKYKLRIYDYRLAEYSLELDVVGTDGVNITSDIFQTGTTQRCTFSNTGDYVSVSFTRGWQSSELPVVLEYDVITGVLHSAYGAGESILIGVKWFAYDPHDAALFTWPEFANDMHVYQRPKVAGSVSNNTHCSCTHEWIRIDNDALTCYDLTVPLVSIPHEGNLVSGCTARDCARSYRCRSCDRCVGICTFDSSPSTISKYIAIDTTETAGSVPCESIIASDTRTEMIETVAL